MKVFAVSGGLDSICASHIMRFRIDAIYHFNHKLRPQNDAMARSVERYAKVLGISLISEENRSTLQTEAEFRHARLNAIFSNRQNVELYTAHHLDDAVESYLLNCFRGHPEYIPIPKETDFGNGNKIIHEFLTKDKKYFQDYALRKGLLEYVVEDETNVLTKGSRRNWIRNSLIPEIESQKIGLRKIVKKKFYGKPNLRS